MNENVLIWVGIAGVAGAVIFCSNYFDKKRREAIAESLSRMGFSFEPGPKPPSWFSASHLPLFERGRNESAKNIGKLKVGNRELQYFDYRYTTGSGKNKSTHHFSVLCLSGDLNLPEFTLGPEDIFSKIAQGLGYDDIDVAAAPEFSKKFVLRGADKEAIQRLFTVEATQALMQHPNLNLEAGRGAIVRYQRGKVDPAQLTSWIEQGKQIFSLFG